MINIYLDHNSCSPLTPLVRKKMIEAMDHIANPSSIHSHGRKAKQYIEDAREKIANFCNINDKRCIIFTSEATEANITALNPFWRYNNKKIILNKLIISSIEHSSILYGGNFQYNNKIIVPVDSNGVIILDELSKVLKNNNPSLVSIMAANNETGVIQPLYEIGKLVKHYNSLLHIDATQAFDKLEINLDRWKADSIAISAHKFGGPQGIGALILRSLNCCIYPLITGGGQENGYRSGTENIIAIAGFGAAIESIKENKKNIENIKYLRNQLERSIKTLSPQIIIFSEKVNRIINTTCFTIPNILAETALIYFDLEGISISSGSACSAGKKNNLSHVLTAMGYNSKIVKNALRISLGWNTTKNDIKKLLSVYSKIINELQ